MHAVISRLVLHLALGAAFGAGQLVSTMAVSHASLASVDTLMQPSASASKTASPAPVRIGWG